jgi:hypothetical protein
VQTLMFESGGLFSVFLLAQLPKLLEFLWNLGKSLSIEDDEPAFGLGRKRKRGQLLTSFLSGSKPAVEKKLASLAGLALIFQNCRIGTSPPAVLSKDVDFFVERLSSLGSFSMQQIQDTSSLLDHIRDLVTKLHLPSRVGSSLGEEVKKLAESIKSPQLQQLKVLWKKCSSCANLVFGLNNKDCSSCGAKLRVIKPMFQKADPSVRYNKKGLKIVPSKPEKDEK